MRDFLAICQRLHDIVFDAWQERCESNESEIVGDDECDRLLALGYVQAFRRYRAIKVIAEDEYPSTEAMMVLVRSLVSVTHRSLYLIHTDDPVERRELQVRYSLLSYNEERKRLAAAVKEVPAWQPALDHVTAMIERLEAALKATGKSTRPVFPTDEEIAKRLGLSGHYDDPYRAGSSDMHHTMFSAFGGFAHVESRNPPVALVSYTAADMQQTLLRAIVVYADFVTRADKVVKLGINADVLALEPKIRSAIDNLNAEPA